MEYWRRSLSNFLKEVARNVDEKVYQESIVMHLLSYGLNWNDEEILQQPSIQIGSRERIIPDIVIQKGDDKLFVVEIKQPRNTQKKENINQLESYLKQLEIPFGLYIGECVELYYKESTKALQHIFTIQLKDTDEHWLKFRELFSRNSFDKDVLRNFCLTEIGKNKDRDDAQNYLSDKETLQELQDILHLHWLSENKSEEWINHVLEHITISVNKKNIQAEQLEIKPYQPPHIKASFVNRTPTIGRDKALYTINGMGPFGVGPLALQIIKHIVELNPQMTFFELQRATTNTTRNNISSLEEIEEKQLDSNDSILKNRYFYKDVLTSGDNIDFVVNSQWTRPGKGSRQEDIGNLIEIACQDFNIDIREV